MAILEGKGANVRNLVVPAAATLVGAGAGLVLTRKPARKSLPDLHNLGIGDLADDLRGKLDAVIGKAQSSSGNGSRSSRTRLSATQLEERVRAREQRRTERRARR